MLVYETLKKAIKTVHGQDFLVFDDFLQQTATENKAEMQQIFLFVSASSEKGIDEGVCTT